MHIEFLPHTDSGYTKMFSEKTGLKFENNALRIPADLGNGFVKRLTIDNGLFIIIHSYRLNELLTVKRKATTTPDGYITFRFVSYRGTDRDYLSNVQVLNDTIDVTDTFPAYTPICNIIVKIKIKKLLSIIKVDAKSKEFSTFTNHLNQPFLYQENITLEMSDILRELSDLKEHGKFEKLYYETKIMELVYHFFVRFSRRTTYDFKNVNKRDIEKILSLEEQILQDLGTPPKLSDLARYIGMSESKMKQLFKKIHGDSIYNYYLSARINEAACILRNDKSMTVSEVGYFLGFSNLSHFANLFKRYIGMNPKEYAMRR
jgi:AraC-like DNA-binding protein